MIDKLKQRMRDLAERTANTVDGQIEQFKCSTEQRNIRYDICKSCDQFNNTTTQCKVCKCVMSVKTYFALSSCPLKKWEAIEKE